MFPESAGAPRTLVKICGITNAEDAHAAIDAGADALGFNLFRGSKRFIDFALAERWICELPSRVAKIAVMVNAPLDVTLAMAERGAFDGLQLHGTESPEFCAQLAAKGIRFAKALPIFAADDVAEIAAFSTRTIVLDTGTAGQFGGSGRTFPWEFAKHARDMHDQFRIILAGGLTPENVAQALRVAQPFGVDVTSGVEAAAGRKDHGRLRAFVQAVRAEAE